jgi:hypothetical protein
MADVEGGVDDDLGSVVGAGEGVECVEAECTDEDVDGLTGLEDSHNKRKEGFVCRAGVVGVRAGEADRVGENESPESYHFPVLSACEPRVLIGEAHEASPASPGVVTMPDRLTGHRTRVGPITVQRPQGPVAAFALGSTADNDER